MDKFAVIREDITPQYAERKKCSSGKCGCAGGSNKRSSEIPAELTEKVAKDLVKQDKKTSS
jgi:hypothetical protein